MSDDRVLFLGCGASLGVPVIGCGCSTCTSDNPKDKRLRSSILLTVDGKKILVDAGPDIRRQALRYRIDHLDGVILTHAHCDHTAGMDDLRIYYFRNHAPLPCLVSKETAEDLELRFHFMFRAAKQERVRLELLPKDQGEIDFRGVSFRYFTYLQQGMKVLGLRCKNFAYLTDIKTYSEKIFDELKNLDILVVSALRYTPSEMHLTVDEAVEFIEKVKPKRAILTHLAHELEYERTNAYLPDEIRLAYDGLELNI